MHLIIELCDNSCLRTQIYGDLVYTGRNWKASVLFESELEREKCAELWKRAVLAEGKDRYIFFSACSNPKGNAFRTVA